VDRRAFLRKSSAGMAAFRALPLLPSGVEGSAADLHSRDFHAEASRVLPLEEPYAFAKALASGIDPELGELDPLAKPTALEMAIPPEAWSLLIPSEASLPLREAADRLQSYLKKAMRTQVNIEQRASLADWSTSAKAIVAGARDQLPGCGAELKGTKDYQIIATPQRVVVCGYDETGVMYGVYNLMERFSLREAPFLPRDLNTVRHSLYKMRMTHSGIGWMDWPDEYLAMLARYGFDSIYGAPYANADGSQSPGVYGGTYRDTHPAAVHDLARRAGRFGIKVYSQIMYNFIGNAESIEGLRKLTRNIVTQFPEIRGYILLSEGFYAETESWQSKDLRQWIKQWCEGVRVVTEECHKINPAIEVLAWEYNIDSKPDKVDLKKLVIDYLPKDSIPFLTFEIGKDFTLDGQTGYLVDYAISQVGPGEVTAAQIAEAQKRGFRDVYSKSDAWASWQFGTMPYLPFPYQWHARDEALEKYGVSGTLESWSYGFKPNFVAETRCWYSWSDSPPLDTLLRAIARRNFGGGSEELVLDAWKHFSQAIQLNPDTGHTTGGNSAVAQPFFFEQPPAVTNTLEHSFLDPRKAWDYAGINPRWPYLPYSIWDGYLLYPDFTNRTNVAEKYAKPFTLPVFEKYLRLAADEMERGLENYRKAALAAPAAKKPHAYREVQVATQIERMLRSDAAMLEFEDLRFQLAQANGHASHPQILDRMVAILKEEIPRTEEALAAAERDSRLGWEWEMDYLYSPYSIRKKLEVLHKVLSEQIPAFRKRHGIPE